MRWAAVTSLAALLAGVPGASADMAHRDDLPNGLRVIIRSVGSTDVVAIELLLQISALDEPPGKHGIRHLVQRLLLRGTKSETGEAMGRQLAAVGGVVDTTVGLDYVEIYALVPADGFEVALELVADAVRNAAFSPREVERERAEARQAVRASRQDPFQETYLAFREGMYGDHPYGRLTLGAPSSLASIAREDAVRFHRDHYRANRAVLAICGGIGRTRSLRATRKAFGGWDGGIAAAGTPAPTNPLTSSELVARERDFGQTHLILGFPAPAVGEAGYYPLQVIDSILSGGQSARLPRTLRDDLGLVYQVSSFYPTLAADSHFGIYAATEPEQLRAVKASVLSVLSDLCEQPVTDLELSRAKRYLLGSYALSHQRMKEQAYALAWYEMLGLGADFEQRYAASVQDVTARDIQETARKVFKRFVLAIAVPIR